jgi:hypothetical protein
MSEAPRTSGHFNRRVRVIRNPVAVAAVEAAAEKAMRCRPEDVAEMRRTPWKKMGLGRWREGGWLAAKMGSQCERLTR